jgi:hypothetical protein
MYTFQMNLLFTFNIGLLIVLSLVSVAGIVMGGLLVGPAVGVATSLPLQQQLPRAGWRPGLHGTKQNTPTHSLKITVYVTKIIKNPHNNLK